MDGRVTVNNEVIEPGYKVNENDVVKLTGKGEDQTKKMSI